MLVGDRYFSIPSLLYSIDRFICFAQARGRGCVIQVCLKWRNEKHRNKKEIHELDMHALPKQRKRKHEENIGIGIVVL